MAAGERPVKMRVILGDSGFCRTYCIAGFYISLFAQSLFIARNELWWDIFSGFQMPSPTP